VRLSTREGLSSIFTDCKELLFILSHPVDPKTPYTTLPAMWFDIPKDSDFSLKNIPLGVCSLSSVSSPTGGRRCVTAIGNKAVDLGVLQDAGAFDDIDGLNNNVFSESTLNKYLSHDPEVWPKVRHRIIELFDGNRDLLSANRELQAACIYDLADVAMHLPCTIGDYTDFYSSREHATNVGVMFRGKSNALQPNWLHLPVGYHGRSSTIQVSGDPVVRPCGQLQVDPDDPMKGSSYGACKQLDFELEVAFFVGGPTNSGPMSMDEAKRRIFGFCLMNDWSARDVQKWEYVPLGPFTAKNFATTISPWIIPAEALEPFKTATSAGLQDNPLPLPYLRDPDYSSFDIQLSVAIRPVRTEKAVVVSRTNFANLYWNAAQQLVHHTVTGCKMNAGDLLASGTISGSAASSCGSMLELSWKGSKTVDLGDGERRTFLNDGDTVIMEGFCSKEGHDRVGFGLCSGTVLPSGTTIPPAMKPKFQYCDFKLYSYWRSSSSWRVRIALIAKGVSFEVIPVNLRLGQQKSDEFLGKNPLGKVPVLECKDKQTGQVMRLTQSIAIIDLLDRIFPESKSLIPMDCLDKIAAMEMVEVINSDVQPLQNAPMVHGLELISEGKITATEFAKAAIASGLSTMEMLIKRRKAEGSRHNGPFCLGSFSPTVVDACLVPQLYNARLWDTDVEKDFPLLASIEKKCNEHPWFIPAHPNVQVDADL
jgi:fumarylacetoacetase